MPGRLLTIVCVVFALCAAPADAIIGGAPASEPYSWMASLQVSERHICGASLVRRDTVLTAAHCVQGERPADLSVVLGRTRLSTTAGERIGVKSIEIHEGFSTDPNGGHDIALVRLRGPTEADTVDLVGGDETGLWAPGRPVRVIGWGSAVYDVGPGSDDLLEADIEVIADDECAASYGDSGIVDFGFDPATMVCAGQRVIGLEDACQGDSGGPLVTHDGRRWVLVGTVSYGLGCGFPLFYGVYGRVGGPVLNGWLTGRLDSPGAPVETPLASPSDVEVTVLRVARRGRTARVRVEVSAPVTALKAILRKRGHVVGRGGLPRVQRAATVVMRVGDEAPRRARLQLTATDAGGQSVTHREAVVLRPRSG